MGLTTTVHELYRYSSIYLFVAFGFVFSFCFFNGKERGDFTNGFITKNLLQARV